MAHKQTDSHKGDILIVDDDLPSLNTLSSMLTTEGYEVRGVPDGQMAFTVIERAMILNTGQTFHVDRFRPEDFEAEQPVRLDELERRHIIDMLERTGWRVSGKNGTAEILGLKPTTLEARMKKLGIERPY